MAVKACRAIPARLLSEVMNCCSGFLGLFHKWHFVYHRHLLPCMRSNLYSYQFVIRVMSVVSPCFVKYTYRGPWPVLAIAWRRREEETKKGEEHGKRVQVVCDIQSNTALFQVRLASSSQPLVPRATLQPTAGLPGTSHQQEPRKTCQCHWLPASLRSGS